MTDFSQTFQELQATGIGFLHLPRPLKDLAEKTLDDARQFFYLPRDVKEKSAFAGMHLGYRGIGIEYSQSPERPDLNESFSYRLSHDSEYGDAVPESAAILYADLKQLADAYNGIANDFFAALATHFDASETSLFSTNLDSWLQVNYYKPNKVEREYMQEKHDDGHLITLWLATGPGLEVFPANAPKAEPLEPQLDHLAVMSGQLLNLLTGGTIPPLYHQVRCHPELSERLSLMYFVNPNTDQEISPWVKNNSNAGINIASKAASNPHQHGLPSLVKTES